MQRLVWFAACFVLFVGGWQPLAAGDDSSAEGAADVKLVYDDGFQLRTADGKFSLMLNGGIQFRYSFVDYDAQVVGNEENYSNFYMRRARLWWRGHAFTPKLKYFIHLQLEPHRLVNSHDLFLEYELDDMLIVGMGRNKVPYGLEFMSSGIALNLVERSVMSGESDIDVGGGEALYPGGGTEHFRLNWFASTGFATGGLSLYRSQGVWLRGRNGGEDAASMEYQVGVWQGRGTMGLSNRADDHLFTARVGYHPWGYVDWRLQGDGHRSERFRAAVFASIYRAGSSGTEVHDEAGWNLAVVSRFRGLSLDAEWGMESYDFQNLDGNFERSGWRAQLGAFVIRDRMELVGRYAQIERLRDSSYQRAMDTGLGVATLRVGGLEMTGIERRISELTFGANYFLNEWHRHKIQVDVSRLLREFVADPGASIEQAPDQEDLRFRAMVQLVF